MNQSISSCNFVAHSRTVTSQLASNNGAINTVNFTLAGWKPDALVHPSLLGERFLRKALSYFGQ
jgi:hypothetical protein